MATHGTVTADGFAIMAAILCLRPTETTVIDVEYKQLEEKHEASAA